MWGKKLKLIVVIINFLALKKKTYLLQRVMQKSVTDLEISKRGAHSRKGGGAPKGGHPPK
jgi:hypothetical protein